MRKEAVELNTVYRMNFHGKLIDVRIERKAVRGWYGRELRTGDQVRVMSATSLRHEVDLVDYKSRAAGER